MSKLTNYGKVSNQHREENKMTTGEFKNLCEVWDSSPVRIFDKSMPRIDKLQAINEALVALASTGLTPDGAAALEGYRRLLEDVEAGRA